ncbi:MAG: hypothetical protein O6940_11830 [Ignavibacteria bacterium]|nr:hypothetical protein [Ignavibacteria bacterium]
MLDSKLIEVKYNDKHWEDFIKFPWKIYENNQHWVPPLLVELNKQLNHSKNPFFKKAKIKYWIAVCNKKVVGRISAIINERHNLYYKDKVGFFGYFECINNDSIAKKLLNKASSWLNKHNMNCICGPINLTPFNECGLLIEGFNTPPFIQMTYNPMYYQKLLNNAGYLKEIDLLAFQLEPNSVLRNKTLIQKLKRINNMLAKNENISFRKFNPKDFTNEIERVRILFNNYMKENWGFIPIEKDEFKFAVTSLRKIIIKEFALFAVVNGQPVGFSIALPDINQVFKLLNGKLFPFGIFKYLYFKNKMSNLRLILMGVNKPFRKKGLEAHFYYHTLMEAKMRNFKNVELSWISEKNYEMLQVMDNMNAQLYKRYRIFKKWI